MRAVSFVPHLEFDFKGNVAKNSICLGDADNDKDNELVIGNLDGDLVIFKGEENSSWAEAHELGKIAVITIGDVFNIGKNSIISISCEGLCNIFNIDIEYLLENETRTLQPSYIQRLPANTKVALLADIDGDGANELILGLTDHVLRTYRWVHIDQNSHAILGKLIGLHKWEFAEQIGSISLNPAADGGNYILVAHPGGAYTNFQCPIMEMPENGLNIPDSMLSKLTPKHHPLALCRMRNPNISSEILGGIYGKQNGRWINTLIAIATLDGTLMLVNGDEILWSLQVDHQLFAITKLDLIGDGQEDVIVCAWDGQTYMVNQKKQSVRFQFEDPVLTFTSGNYSVISGCPVPTLVYATFNERVHLYYDVHLPSFEINTYTLALEKHPATSNFISKFNNSSLTKKKIQVLLKLCLYNYNLLEDWIKLKRNENL